MMAATCDDCGREAAEGMALVDGLCIVCDDKQNEEAGR